MNNKIHFECDYTEGAHEKLMARLLATNLEQTVGYGEDEYCVEAAALVKKLCAAPDADVHFLTGGTQCNLVTITAALRPHQGVLCADTGHIAVHESGAIEAAGHKVLTLPGTDGKITAQQVKAAVDAHYADDTHEHQVQPAMIYLSQPTECGTLYTLAELTEMRRVCDECGLLLYVDGARLAYALGAKGNDVTMPDLARLCDAFYIGGTKCGALFGEALVLCNGALKRDFRYILKQRVGRFAKGRLMGIQFLELLSDGLYEQIGREADTLACEVRDGFTALGYPLYMPSETNQQFPILPDSLIAKLGEKYVCSYWCRIDETHSAVRFATSWATKRENVTELLQDVAEK